VKIIETIVVREIEASEWVIKLSIAWNNDGVFKVNKKADIK